jgi:uncharacterized membrane protein YccC
VAQAIPYRAPATTPDLAAASHLLSYPLYRLWTDIGERAVSFALGLVIVSIIAFVFVGSIPFSPKELALFALSVPFAFLIVSRIRILGGC